MVAERPPGDGPPALASRLWRLAKGPLAALALSALVATGYAGYIYARYLLPKTPLPAADASIGERFAAGALPETLTRDAEMRLLTARDEASLPAVSAAIGLGGELRWAQAIGYSDLESRAAVGLGARFRLGSISKPLTGVLLGRLVERGRIQLDRPIGDLVDALPTHLRSITPRQLATHTAGIRDYRVDLFSHPPHEGLQNERYGSVAEALSIFASDPLLFEPGTDFSYTTYGFVLLSRTLELAGGTDFPSLMAREVFEPAGMLETSAEHTGQPISDGVGYYETGGGLYTPSFPVDNSFRWAGGGFVGSARDLARFGNAVLSGRLLASATRATLFAPQRLPNGEINPQSYALGWRSHESTSILGEDAPLHIAHHGGRQAGGSAFLLLVPKGEHSTTDLAVAVLANSGASKARAAVQALAVDLARLALLETGGVP